MIGSVGFISRTGTITTQVTASIKPCMKRRAITLAALLLITAIAGVPRRSAAQPPISAPHPTMPWNQFSSPDYGQPIRYIEVPTQQIVLEMALDVPPGVPPETRSQIVEIP